MKRADSKQTDFVRTTAVQMHRMIYLMDKSAERVLQDSLNLTFSKYFVLSQIVNDCHCQRDIAGLLGVTPAAISRHVAQLISDGLLERVPHEDDRRYGFVRATERGIKIHAQASQALDEFFSSRLQAIPDAEKADFAASIVRMAKCFEDCNQTMTNKEEYR